MKSKITFAKRAFSLLIAVLMLASILPAAIAAEGEATGYTAVEGIEWTKGYVKPDNGSLTTGNYYSRSSVFVIEKAGTVVTFTDTDGSYASSGAAVFTGWNLVDDEWVFDETIALNGANAECYKDVNGTRVYYYVTTKDNQGLRISYRSEQTDDFVPEHVTVYTTSYANWVKDNEVSYAPAELQNATFVPVTNFNDIGAGTANALNGATVSVGANGLSVVRNDDDWQQEVDWTFTAVQNWTGMTGVLVKVDFTKANTNTNSGNGGHGVTLGIKTANGTTVFNDPTLGGSAFVNSMDNWVSMGACKNYTNLLVATPSTINRYAGYVFIPATAFGANGVEGLESVSALSIYNGACTSGTAVIEKIWLVKAADASMKMAGYQDTTAQGGDTFDVRFLATINTLNVESYGFVVTATYFENGVKTVEKTYENLTTVYTGVLAAGEEQNAAAGEYFAPMTLKGIPANLEICFTVEPYYVINGTVVYGVPAVYTVNAN